MRLARKIIQSYGNYIENITVSGGRCLYAEGAESIAEYTENCVKIKLSNGFVIIDGKKLTIEKYSQGDVVIAGKILAVRYE